MNKWGLLRIGLIVFVAAFSVFAPLGPQVKPPIDWNTLAIIFLFIPFGLFLVIAMQAANPWSSKVWQKPDWGLNPINLKDPIQLFHLGAYILLVQGVVTMLRISIENVPFYVEALLPTIMGLGILTGIQIVMLVFRKKYN